MAFMDMCGASSKILIFCGRNYFHFYSLDEPNIEKRYTSMSLVRFLDSDKDKSCPDKLSVVACALSPCSKLLAFSDSEKNVYIFEMDKSNWELLSSLKLEARVMKMRFVKARGHLVMIDKLGSIWISILSSNRVYPARKLSDDNSIFISALISNNSNQMFTNGYDDKVVISTFPEAYKIDEFALNLDENEFLVTMCFIKNENFVVTMTTNSNLAVWNRADRKKVAGWNIFEMLHVADAERPKYFQTLHMKLTEVFKDNAEMGYLAIIMKGYAVIPILELNYDKMFCRKYNQVPVSSDFCDIVWQNETLYVYQPEAGLLEKYIIHPCGFIHDNLFPVSSIMTEANIKRDVKGYGVYNKNFYPAALKRLEKKVDSLLEYEFDLSAYQMPNISPTSVIEITDLFPTANPSIEKLKKLKHIEKENIISADSSQQTLEEDELYPMSTNFIRLNHLYYSDFMQDSGERLEHYYYSRLSPKREAKVYFAEREAETKKLAYEKQKAISRAKVNSFRTIYRPSSAKAISGLAKSIARLPPSLQGLSKFVTDSATAIVGSGKPNPGHVQILTGPPKYISDLKAAQGKATKSLINSFSPIVNPRLNSSVRRDYTRVLPHIHASLLGTPPPEYFTEIRNISFETGLNRKTSSTRSYVSSNERIISNSKKRDIYAKLPPISAWGHNMKYLRGPPIQYNTESFANIIDKDKTVKISKKNSVDGRIPLFPSPSLLNMEERIPVWLQDSTQN